MVVASFIVSTVALIASACSVWFVRQQTAEARRSADAAEHAERRAELIEQRRRLGWRIEPVADAQGLFILRNTGWEDAKAVQITSDMAVGLQHDVKEVDLAAGQGISILAFPKVEDSALDIYVSWTIEGGDSRSTWTEPLPVRPPLWIGTQTMRAFSQFLDPGKTDPDAR